MFLFRFVRRASAISLCWITSSCGSVVRTAPSCEVDAAIDATDTLGDAGAGATGDAAAEAAGQGRTAPIVPSMRCGGDVGNVELKMPCKLGLAPIYALECESDAGPWGFLAPIGDLNPDVDLNRSIDLNLPITPPSVMVSSGGVSYALFDFHAQVAFYELNLEQRAFVARISHADFTWTSADGKVLVCPLDNGLLWAVPGDFL